MTEKTLSNPEETGCAWDLFDAPVWYKTDQLETFLYFLKSPGTTSHEISSLNGVKVILAVHGSSGTLVFEKDILRITKPKKKELCDALAEFPDAMGKIPRRKISSALSGYFLLKSD